MCTMAYTHLHSPNKYIHAHLVFLLKFLSPVLLNIDFMEMKKYFSLEFIAIPSD